MMSAIGTVFVAVALLAVKFLADLSSIPYQ
jgi:hypothetical protein